MKHLEVHPHPACCGISNVGYWGFSTTNINSMGPRPLDELEKDLLDAERVAPGGLMLTTLNEEQIPHCEYLLEKHGWSPLVQNFGGNHGKATTLYGKVKKTMPNTRVGKLEYDGKAKRVVNSTPRAATPAPTVSKPAVAPRPVARTTSVRSTTTPVARWRHPGLGW